MGCLNLSEGKKVAQWTALSFIVTRIRDRLLFLNSSVMRPDGPFSEGGAKLASTVWSQWCRLVLQDSVWGMNHSALHSVFQASQASSQQSNFEAVQSGKKKKKQKMVRADPSLLGEHRPQVLAGC